MALPATGATITLGGIRDYFGLSGAVSLHQLGSYISPSVTTNIKLSSTFGGWENPNPTGSHG
jgi:hypothetical protein